MTDTSRTSKYVGMDVHKETIAIGVADAGREAPRYYGEIENTPAAVRRLVFGFEGLRTRRTRRVRNPTKQRRGRKSAGQEAHGSVERPLPLKNRKGFGTYRLLMRAAPQRSVSVCRSCDREGAVAESRDLRAVLPLGPNPLQSVAI